MLYEKNAESVAADFSGGFYVLERLVGQEIGGAAGIPRYFFYD